MTISLNMMMHSPSQPRIMSEIYLFAQRLRDLIAKYGLIHPECEIKYFISNIKSNAGNSIKLTLNWPQDVDLIIEYGSVDNYIDYIIL